MMKHSPYALGATLYMPATRDDIVQVALRNKIPHLRSMVICLEDAVADHEVEQALANLITITRQLATHRRDHEQPIIFIRPRDLDMAAHIVAHYDLTGIDGFVFPKFTLATLPEWEAITASTHLMWMPTLETQEVFDGQAMQQLANALHASPMRDRIIALRIGGNDLMSILGIRRSRHATIYEGPLNYVMKMLTCTFGAKGFALTSPVFELIDNVELLEQELQLDLIHGLVGKTAIHPSQIACIHEAWMVDPSEYEDAIRIINSTQAVYQHGGAMCEPATHRQWAKNILERRQLFGLRTPEAANAKEFVHL
ncbi:HpcH/HpaI aldolase/citrate lyase family protein [Photobacterium aphoticum]|nr:HpcH/HpaI aldolase/citrate lyase family protein [Photobacterium aphoticum]GHA63596.1 citrate lyase subunit beta [Photobacterium aphoticum]